MFSVFFAGSAAACWVQLGIALVSDPFWLSFLVFFLFLLSKYSCSFMLPYYEWSSKGSRLLWNWLARSDRIRKCFSKLYLPTTHISKAYNLAQLLDDPSVSIGNPHHTVSGIYKEDLYWF